MNFLSFEFVDIEPLPAVVENGINKLKKATMELKSLYYLWNLVLK